MVFFEKGISMDASQTPAASRPGAGARRAFTLVEMLVVITIIAILAALVSVGVVKALETAKQSRIKIEVDGLDAAFRAYKEKYGSYPPCDLRFDPGATDASMAGYNAALRAHLARAFPRYTFANNAALQTALQNAGVDTINFRPDQALVFWLSGFSPDVTNPFVPWNSTLKTALFDFDKTRLLQVQATGAPGTATIPSYFPSGVTVSSSSATNPATWTGGGAPYVYFDSQTYSLQPPTMAAAAQPYAFNAQTASMPLPLMPNVQVFAGAGPAVPYWNDVNGNSSTNLAADFNMLTGAPTENWANPDSFQIICTGLDGKYGLDPTTIPPARLYPTGFNYDPAGADDDNVTNFSVKARIGDAKP
jgi:prepilin-type N-terminal cleavage/methylation domain-containing protein